MRKKLLIVLLSAVCVICFAFGLVACGDSNSDGGGDVAVTEVTLNKSQATLAVGGTVTLEATVKPDNAKDKTVSWSSTVPAVASVSDGVVTAKSEGTTIVSATAGGKSAKCTVTVNKSGQSDIAVKYTVKFETNGAAAIADKTVEKGDSFTLPVPTRENFIFDGWFVNSAFGGDALEGQYTPAKDITLYAKWTPEAAEAKYLNFTLSEDGKSYSVSAKENAAELTSLTVPTTYRKLPVTKIDSSAFKPCTALESVNIPDGIVSIGAEAFGGCSKLKQITVADSVTEIASSAFTGCSFETAEIPLAALKTIKTSALKNLNITSGTDVVADSFSSCANLESLVLPETVTTIAKGALSACKKLKDVTLPFVGSGISENGHFGYIFGADGYLSNSSAVPQSLKEVTVLGGDISKWAFFSCNKIEKITVEGEVGRIYDKAFQGCKALKDVEIKDGVKKIGEAVFADCGNLASLKVPYVGANNDDIEKQFGYFFGNKYFPGSELTYQQTGSFYIPSALKKVTVTGGKYDYGTFTNCKNLEEVILPEGLDCIADYMFSSCVGLKSIVVPEGVEEIGMNAYNGCDNAKSLYIPASVKKIGYSALRHLPSIAQITVDPQNTAYRSENNCLIDSEKNQIILGTASSAIPTSVASIGDSAFFGCDIKSIKIPSNIRFIGFNAFTSCASLASVTFSNGLETVGSGAFSNCESLKSLTFPEGMTYLGDGAIYNCSSLTSVSLPSTLTRCESNFYGCDKLTLKEYNNALYMGNSSNPYLVLVRVKDKNITSFQVHSDTVIISESAFDYCKSLKSVTFGNKIKTIEDNAFYKCTSLTSFAFPASVTYVGYSVLRDCTALQTFTFGSEIEGYCPDFSFVEDTPLHGTATYNNATYSGPAGNPYLILVKATSKGISSCTIHPDTKYILEGAFRNCTSLKSITIPDSVTDIGFHAFEGCTSLTTATFGKNVEWTNSYIFYGCTSLSSVTLNAKLEYISNSTFGGCTSLKSITIPEGVTQINDSAFSKCTALTQITLPKSMTSVSSSAFSGCTALTAINVSDENEKLSSLNGVLYNKEQTRIIAVPLGISKFTIEDSVENIDCSKYTGLADTALTSYNGALYLGTKSNPYYALMRTANKTITSCTVHSNTEVIAANAFSGCDKMTQITLGSKVKEIGASAFYNCKLLNKITIPDSVNTVGDSAFYNCSALAELTLGKGVKSVGRNAFSGANKLADVYYKSDISDWCCINFANESSNPLSVTLNASTLTNKLYIDNTLVTKITLPATLMGINNYAFCGYKSLTNITIPDSVYSIGNSVFRGCTALTEIKLPKYITRIEAYAFYGCTSLKTMTIPANVVFIGSYAFYRCTALTGVTFENKTGWLCGTKAMTVTDSATNATNLIKTYYSSNWAVKTEDNAQ